MATVHQLKAIDRLTRPKQGTTFCGKVGCYEGADEWTTLDGIESRFEAIDASKGITCKSCLRAARAAAIHPAAYSSQ